MIYTPMASAAVRSIPMPVDMDIDVVDMGDYIALRFYEGQWAHISESERMKMAMYFQAVRKTLLQFGINSTLDPVYDTPGIQKI